MTMKLLFIDQILKVNWIQKFLIRHKKLNFTFSKFQNKERVVINEKIINDWFRLYFDILKQHDFYFKDIYNMNEKDFTMKMQNKLKIICFKNDRDTDVFNTQCDNREWVFLLKCVSNDGEILKIWFIFKEKQHQKNWFNVL